MHSVSLLLSLTMTAAPLAAVTPAKTPPAASAPAATPRLPAPAAAPAPAAPAPATVPSEPAAAGAADSAPPPPKLVLDETPEPPPSVSPPPPPPRMDLRTPAPPPPVERRIHLHDGLYLRLALGFTGFSESIVSKLEEGDKPRDEGYQGGFGSASEVAIGGTIGNGFVLGGGLYSANILTSTYTQIRGTPVPDALQRPATFSILGLMGDWYVRPRSGFHAQAALGLAVLTGLDVSTPRFENRNPAFGGGAMVGAGYEWWAADEWGFGILLRATAGIVSEKDDAGERWFHLATASPSILFSATYN